MLRDHTCQACAASPYGTSTRHLSERAHLEKHHLGQKDAQSQAMAKVDCLQVQHLIPVILLVFYAIKVQDLEKSIQLPGGIAQGWWCPQD